MEPPDNITAIPSEQPLSSQPIEPHSNKKFLLILVAVIVLFLLTAGILLWQGQNTPPKTQTKNIITPTSQPSQSVVSNFFLTKPNVKTLSEVTVNTLPNTKDIRGVAEYNGHLWVSGDGSIVEIDPKTNSIVRYSDPSKANCDSNLVIIRSTLYAACYMKGSLEQKDTNGYPVYGIYKINLKTYGVEKVFTNKDGLQNQQNYTLYADNPYIWIRTFEGVGRIDTTTDKADFFTRELGTSGNHFGISTILVDNNHVWVHVNANAESTGGLSLYNKSTKTWTSFGPNELKMNPDNRLDLEWNKHGYALKKIPGGIKVAFRDGTRDGNDLLGENEYSYSTGQWTKLPRTREASGQNYEQTTAYLDQEYLPGGLYAKNDKKGFTQIYTAESEEPKHTIFGRAFLTISDVINSKRYLITSSSVDVLSDITKLPTIMLETERDIDRSRPHPTETDITLYKPEKGTIALIVDPHYYPGFEGPPFWGTLHIWALDTKTDSFLKDVTSNVHYSWRTDKNLNVIEEGTMVFLVTSKGERVASFNTTNNSLTILDTKIEPDTVINYPYQ